MRRQDAYACGDAEETSCQGLGVALEGRAHLHVRDSVRDVENGERDHDDEHHCPVAHVDVDQRKENA